MPRKRALTTPGRTVSGLRRTIERVTSALGLPVERTYHIGTSEASFEVGFQEARYLDYLVRAERHVLGALVQAARPDDVLWDVGAGYGLYTCLVPAGTVVAFEPDGERRRALKGNLARNGLDASVLDVFLGAGVTGGTRSAAAMVRDGEAPRPTLVKIDVEGAEGDVVAGMGDLLDDPDLRLAFVEVHPEDLEGDRQHGKLSPKEIDAIVSTFEEAGFDIERIHRPRSPPFLRAARDGEEGWP